MWFEQLCGFREADVDDVAEQFDLAVDGFPPGEVIRSRANGRVVRVGRFTTPTLSDLRTAAGRAIDDNPLGGHRRRLTLREVVGDVRALHADQANAGALFQVASQMNTLEMVHPTVTPEDGVGIYEHDHTQGPACAVACGAGTIHRNWLVEIDGHRGQTASRQINCFADLAGALEADIEIRNGYVFPTREQLDGIATVVDRLDEKARDQLLAHLRIGVQSDTEVTLPSAQRDGRGHLVSQAYCSAMPVGYSPHDAGAWEPLARLVLDGAYEATLAAGVVNARRTGCRTVYLTLLGGGVFGNDIAWIVAAIHRALTRFADADLDVVCVSYGRARPELAPLLT